MQQSINTSTQQNLKFNFFNKNKPEKEIESFFCLIKTISSLVAITFILVCFSNFLRVSKHLEKVPQEEVKLKIEHDRLINSLSVSLNAKFLGSIQLNLNLLNELNSVELNNQAINLLLNNAIYEKNNKYSPEYKMIVSSYLLNIKNNISVEARNLSEDNFYKNSKIYNFKEDLLNKKFSDSYSKYIKDMSKFKTSYAKLINNIDDGEVNSMLKMHLEDLSSGFDIDFKKITPP